MKELNRCQWCERTQKNSREPIIHKCWCRIISKHKDLSPKHRHNGQQQKSKVIQPNLDTL